MSSAYETLPLTRWGYAGGVLHEFESVMMHSVTNKIIWGPPRRAMKMLSPSVDTNIMETSLDEGYLYSLTLRNQKLKCILIINVTFFSDFFGKLPCRPPSKTQTQFFDFFCHWFDFVTAMLLIGTKETAPRFRNIT